MLFYVRDRMHSTPKKAVDVIHRESMIMNTLGQKAYSNFNQGSKENIANGRVEKKLNDSFSVAAVQKDAWNPNMLNQVKMKMDAGEEGNGPMAPECSSLKKDHPTENSLKMPPTVDSVNGFPISSLNGGECSVESVPSFKGSNGFVNLGNSVNGGSSTCTGLPTPVTKQDDSNGLHSSAGKNENDSVSISTTRNIKASAGKELDNAVDRPQNSNVLHRSSEDISIPSETNAVKVIDSVKL